MVPLPSPDLYGPPLYWYGGMEGDAGEALVKMLRKRSWSDLSGLGLSENPYLLVYRVEQGLVAAMQDGHLPRLEWLRVAGSGLT